MREHLDWALKLGSFTSKVFAVGVATVGIARLWSASARQKHSLSARIAYSSAYLLHVGTTSLAAAAFMGSTPISPQIATALMGATSLLTNYVNVLDTQASHSMIKEECRTLEDKVSVHQQILEQKISLLEASKEYLSQIEALREEIAGLQNLLKAIPNARKQPEAKRIDKLIDLHQNLTEIFANKTKRNEIVIAFFATKSKPIDIDAVLKEIASNIESTTQKINSVNTQLQRSNTDKLKYRATVLAEELDKWGVLNVQGIRYKKIETTIAQLKVQLAQLDKLTPVHAQLIKPILMGRIKALQENLDQIINPPVSQTWALDFPFNTTLPEYIREDIQGFEHKLNQSIKAQIQVLQKQIAQKQENAAQIQGCLNVLFDNPTKALQQHYSMLRTENHALIAARRNLKVERFKKEAGQTNVNFCSITTLLAISLCLVPEDNTNFLIKMLMIGFGFLGSTASFTNFCKKFILEMDQDEQMQRRMKMIEKELSFNETSRLQETAEQVQDKRPQRQAKEIAVTRMYALRRHSKGKGPVEENTRLVKPARVGIHS